MKKIVRINMSTLKVADEAIDTGMDFFGGRGLAAHILSHEVDPNVHPLDKKNKIVIAPGLFAGTIIPCTSRLSVGSKSPLTGGIKESNVGGPIAQQLGRRDIAAIVLEGQPSSGWYVISVGEKGDVQLDEADGIQGLGNYETVQRLHETYGKRVSIMSIGRAGEMRLPVATIAATDGDGFPSRHAGRGGLGAVLGSKHIKAVVVQNVTADNTQIVDRNLLTECLKEFSAFVRKVNVNNNRFGTASLIKVVNEFKALPTRNFTSGQFDRAENISGEKITEVISKRGGKTGHACYPGCVIKCSHIFNDKAGNYVTSKLEYETVAMLGANVGIGEIDDIARIDQICGDLGIDTIETGATIGVLMHCGYIAFGDSSAVINLLSEIQKGTVVGRLIGSGCAAAARAFGNSRVPVVKGQALPAYDPRAFKGMGVTFATSPMGADHTAGPIFPGMGKLDPRKPTGQAELSKDLQIACAALDNFGLCLFTSPSSKTLEFIGKFIKALTGTALDSSQIQQIGKKILALEYDFNERAGLGAGTDELPYFFREESLTDLDSVFDVPKEKLRAVREAFKIANGGH